MKKLITTCAFLAASPVLLPAQERLSPETLWKGQSAILFQISTLDALSEGLYGGIYSIAALRQHGDFGLGTFEGIDGEMTIFDGHFYHFHADGTLTEESDRSRVPFAVITRFRPENRFSANALSMDQLSQEIDRHLPSTNLFYAIRVHGNFSAITTRAIPKLYPPYPPLSEVISEEVEFPFENVNGTIVAFRCPNWVNGINQTGYHYHFVSDDRTIGGHVLTLATGTVTVEIQQLEQNQIWVPDHGPFLAATLPDPK